MVRLRHCDPSQPGISRVRHGKGFRYLTPDGRPAEAEDVARAKALVIPPAWKDVWICPWPNGHIQATGYDEAGRHQYLYHEEWRRKRDRLKHDHVLEFAATLPGLREHVAADMRTRGLNRERVLSAGLRLLDLGLFRVGNERYRSGHHTFGLATLERRHVRLRAGAAEFSYPAKGGIERTISVTDADTLAVLRALVHRKHGGARLLAYHEAQRWHEVRSEDLNQHLREVTGFEATAKDFRTWHATVLVAVALAVSQETMNGSRTARRRAVARAVAEAADYLGNTPAVCRRSYVDSRVIDLFEQGETISDVLTLGRLGRDTPERTPATHGAVEAAVLKLLDGH